MIYQFQINNNDFIIFLTFIYIGYAIKNIIEIRDLNDEHQILSLYAAFDGDSIKRSFIIRELAGSSIIEVDKGFNKNGF